MFMETTISGLLTGVSDIFNAAVDMVTGNVVGAVIIGASLVSVGIGLFRKIRR